MDAPQKISKYTVLNRLGTGGMAEVFKCRLSGVGGFEKLVVVKRILPHLVEDEAFVRMFLDEARIAANLNHPNIVQVYEIAQDDDGTPFIAMEFVRGPTLSQLVRKVIRAGDVHLGRLARLIGGAAAGLDYAHNARGPDGKPLHIVHRDVSPQNTLVSTDGVAKILDFGVAKAEGRLSQTQGAVMKGKLRYMAPEVVASGGARVDRRTDVFSLGVCLYVATTGKMPFDGPDDTAVLSAVAKGEFALPSTLVPHYPAELERVLKWAMATDPEQRCPTARALSEALFAFANTQPGSSEGDIAEWLAKHFPVGEDAWGSPDARSPSGLSKLMPRASQAEMPMVEASLEGSTRAHADGSVDVPMEMTGAHVSKVTTPPKSSWGPRVGAGVVVALLVAAGGWLATRGPPPAPMPTAPAESSIQPLLDETSRALSEGKVSLASQLLATARTRGRVPALEEARLVQLEAQVKHDGRVAEARRAFGEGKREEARSLVDAVLGEEPDHRGALALKAKWEEDERAAAAAMTVDAGPVVQPEPPRLADGKSVTLLSVNSEPAGASVLVDDRLAGTTPLRGLKLAAGAHVVLVKKAGFGPATEKVVAAGKPLSILATLVADAAAPVGKGSLRLVTFEGGESTWASVTVDGKRIDKVTPVVLELTAGTHQVQVERAGFQPVDKSVEVVAGKTETVRIELKP